MIDPEPIGNDRQIIEGVRVIDDEVGECGLKMPNPAPGRPVSPGSLELDTHDLFETVTDIQSKPEMHAASPVRAASASRRCGSCI